MPAFQGPMIGDGSGTSEKPGSVPLPPSVKAPPAGASVVDQKLKDTLKPIATTGSPIVPPPETKTVQNMKKAK